MSVGGSEPRSTITFVDYGDESDAGGGGPEGWTSADAAGLAILPGLVGMTKRCTALCGTPSA